MTQALVELFLLSLPIVVWLISLHSIGEGNRLNFNSPAVNFLGLSIWLATLRDGLKAFHRETEASDRFQKEIITLTASVGVVLASILLAMSVTNSVQPERYILSFHSEFSELLIFSGASLCWFTKTVLIQRREYQAYYP